MTKNEAEKGRRATEGTFLRLVLLTLVLGGGLAVAVVYGPGALLSALPVLLLGAALILIPWFLLSGLGRWRARMEQEERAALDQPQEDSDE